VVVAVVIVTKRTCNVVTEPEAVLQQEHLPEHTKGKYLAPVLIVLARAETKISISISRWI
jgi:hypothetical protein